MNILCLGLLIFAADTSEAFQSKLTAVLGRHLNQLLEDDGSVVRIKGKTAQADNALAFYLAFEATGQEKFQKAALSLADAVLKDMRATKFGVLPIKEKDKPGGETIIGGGPPALGAYASDVAYILHREGGRSRDLLFIAEVIDRYPWSEDGWWAATIDVATGEPKLPLSKPSIINKSAAMAMASGILSGYVRVIDPQLALRLKRRADKCLYSQIIPAQEPDGFWHYSFSGNDPKNKDVLGYFMLTTNELMNLQKFNPEYRESKFNAALEKAQAFALRSIAAPARYSLEDDLKRFFQLGRILLVGGHSAEGIRIMDAALDHFPSGNAGQDGAHAAGLSAVLLSRAIP